VRTKALTAASLSALSTVLARWLTSETPSENTAGAPELLEKLPAWFQSRSAKMFAFGLLFAGPSAHYWNLWIEEVFKGAPASALTAVKKVFLDQVTYGPLCNFAAMAFIGLLVEGQPIRQWQRTLKQTFVTTQIKGWKVWPLATLINYKLIPVDLRPLFMNLVALFWTTLLVTSARAQRPPPPPPDSAPPPPTRQTKDVYV